MASLIEMSTGIADSATQRCTNGGQLPGLEMTTLGILRMQLHELPLDILFLVLKMSGNNDIYSYLKSINISGAEKAMKVLSKDKQDWAYLFNVIVKARSLSMSSNVKSIDEADTQDVASWFLHSITLNYKYTSLHPHERRELFVRKIGVSSRVTWLKLLLGHWCLIAAADDSKSELSLWEIETRGGTRLSSRIYLDAPVMDGRVEYHNEGTRCAISVGATRPYVIVLGLSQHSRSASFQQLSYVPDFSHVLFFQGDLIGLGTRDGDDTYPYIVNWKTGEISCLLFPQTNLSINCPLPIEPCKAIILKHGLIFTLHVNSVHVFNREREGSRCPQHLAILPLSIPVADGYFLDDSFTSYPSVPRDTTVYLIYQSAYSGFHMATIEINPAAAVSRMFSMKESTFKPRPGTDWAHLWYVGTSGKILFCVNSSVEYSGKTSASFAFLKVTNAKDNTSALQMDHRRISDKNLPHLKLISCADFDDGNGLLLMSTASGDVRLASVLKESIISLQSTRNDLGASAQCEATDPVRIYHVPTNLDLPLFYAIRRNHRVHDELPDEIVQQVSAAWTDSRIGVLTIDDWSNDWSKFERIWDWILPLSRWGPIDRDFLHDTEGVIVRDRLHTIGEVIPILYRLENHQEMLFRIGQKLFYSRTEREEDDGRDFEMNMLGRLGALPLTYDQFLAHPSDVISSVMIPDNQTNLASWEGSEALSWRVTIVHSAYESLESRDAETSENSCHMDDE
ncbi:hypothetical protein ACEPAF_45 [Sanghuangporus sanghuang]